MIFHVVQSKLGSKTDGGSYGVRFWHWNGVLWHATSSGKLGLQHLPCCCVPWLDGNTLLRGDLFLGKLFKKVIHFCILTGKWNMLHSVCGDKQWRRRCEGVGSSGIVFLCMHCFQRVSDIHDRAISHMREEHCSITCEASCGVWLHILSVFDICREEQQHFLLWGVWSAYNLLHFHLVEFTRDQRSDSF